MKSKQRNTYLILFLILSFTILSCSKEVLPFKINGFGGGFGGPQNEDEKLVAKKIKHNPIIFVHGYTAYSSYFLPARKWFIKNAGYNVHELFAVEFTDNDMIDIYKAAAELKRFVELVKKYTNKDKVVLIGHSRGVSTIRAYIRKLGGKNNVSHLVYIAGALHGHSRASGRSIHRPYGRFIREMNSPTETLPGIKYLCIRAQTDRYFTGRFTYSPFLKGAKNVTIPFINHLNVARSERTFKIITKFLKEPENG